MPASKLHTLLFEDRTSTEDLPAASILIALVALWLSGAAGVYKDYRQRVAQQAFHQLLVEHDIPVLAARLENMLATSIAAWRSPAPETDGDEMVEIAEGAVFADFRDGHEQSVFEPSINDNTYQGALYGGPFLLENLKNADIGVSLFVKLNEAGERPSMAEMRTQEHFGYGRYETIMRPTGESGSVTAFFTYTGPPFGDPHDEVDIEFVGARPNRVEFNYFKNGKPSKKSLRYDLGFDASAEMNLYGFDWLPDKIIWYVNGIEVHRTQKDGSDIPTNAGKLYISAWTGTERMFSWTGEPDFDSVTQADFECISFTPLGQASRTCSDQWEARSSEQTRPIWSALRALF